MNLNAHFYYLNSNYRISSPYLYQMKQVGLINSLTIKYTDRSELNK